MIRQMLCACALIVTSSAVFAADLYTSVRTTSGINQLLRLPNADPTNPVVVGETSVGLAGMAYDPRTDELIARSRSGDRMYRVNRYTAETTGFPALLGETIGGFTYVPSVDEIMVITEGDNGPQDDLISRLLPDGSLELLFDLDAQVGDLDDLSWNPITSELIATDSDNGLFYVINELDGSVLETRAVNNSPYLIGSGSINPINGLMYSIASPGVNPSPINKFSVDAGQYLETVGSIPGISLAGDPTFVPEPAALFSITAILLIVIRRR